MTFTSLLETIGKDFAKGLQWTAPYAVPAEKLVAILFPATAPAVAGLADATTLVQTAVMLVEQKYAAAGAQKLADAMQLAGPVVTQLLKQAGVETSSTYIQSLVSAVVAILNVQTMPTATATA
jgi:hypothetical protein